MDVPIFDVDYMVRLLEEKIMNSLAEIESRLLEAIQIGYNNIQSSNSGNRQVNSYPKISSVEELKDMDSKLSQNAEKEKYVRIEKAFFLQFYY